MDLAVHDIVLAWRNPALSEVFYGITKLGDTIAIIVIAILATFYFLYRSQWPLAAGLLTSLVLSIGAAYILKELVQRPRPASEFFSIVIAHSYSFPSSHATRAMAAYGFFMVAIFRLSSNAWIRSATGFACVSIIILIGFSRLYLSAHFLSDVIGGFVVGGLGVIFGTYVERRFTLLRSAKSDQAMTGNS